MEVILPANKMTFAHYFQRNPNILSNLIQSNIPPTSQDFTADRTLSKSERNKKKLEKLEKKKKKIRIAKYFRLPVTIVMQPRNKKQNEKKKYLDKI